MKFCMSKAVDLVSFFQRRREKLLQWKKDYPGPYQTVRFVCDYKNTNPCSHMPFTWCSGDVMLSNPGQMDVVTPENHLSDVIDHLKSRGASHYILEHDANHFGYYF